MQLIGSRTIHASRDSVWDALNDPDLLGECITGCESIERTEENQFRATVSAKVGPVKAKFTGVVTLSDLDPPNGYKITGEGKGGAAGFVRGGGRGSARRGSRRNRTALHGRCAGWRQASADRLAVDRLGCEKERRRVFRCVHATA